MVTANKSLNRRLLKSKSNLPLSYRSCRRHTSPTKRLISLKNSTVEHKKLLKDTVHLSQNYALTYCSSPGRSYIIEPHGGELNYKLAEKNLNKFFDHVFNQEITQHKLKEQGG